MRTNKFYSLLLCCLTDQRASANCIIYYRGFSSLNNECHENRKINEALRFAQSKLATADAMIPIAIGTKLVT